VLDQHASHFFQEAFRTLKPGGLIRITAPDIDLYWRALARGDRRFFVGQERQPEVSLVQQFLFQFASQTSVLRPDPRTRKISDDEFEGLRRTLTFEQLLDECTSRCQYELEREYVGDHINWWNLDKLTRLLGAAGFRDVRRSGYGQSDAAVLRDTAYFDSTVPHISIYVEATKPRV
jgi:hypothetical protein